MSLHTIEDGILLSYGGVKNEDVYNAAIKQ